MLYLQEFDIDTFEFWSGARDTINSIEEADLMQELAQLIEDTFSHTTPSDTEINDFVWHDASYIFETLGLNEDGELEEDFFEEFINDGLTINLNKHSLNFGESTLVYNPIESMMPQLIINNIKEHSDFLSVLEEIEAQIIEESFETALYTSFDILSDEEIAEYRLNTDFYIELNKGFFAQFYVPSNA